MPPIQVLCWLLHRFTLIVVWACTQERLCQDANAAIAMDFSLCHSPGPIFIYSMPCPVGSFFCSSLLSRIFFRFRRSILFSHTKFTGFQASDVCLFATVSSFFIAISFVFIMLYHANLVSFFFALYFRCRFDSFPLLFAAFFLVPSEKEGVGNNQWIFFSNSQYHRLISFALFKISVSIQCWNVKRKKIDIETTKKIYLFLWHCCCMFCASLFFNIVSACTSSARYPTRKMLCINKSATRELQKSNRESHSESKQE